MEAKAQRRRNRMPGRVKENIELTLMSLPAVILFIVFAYLPMFGVILAFKKFNPNLGILGSEWVGLKNFEFFFTSNDAGRVLTNTVAYSLTFLIIDVVIAVGLAILFYNLRSKIGLKVYNTIVILPRFMSMVMIAFVIYTLFSPTFGLINNILTALGFEAVQWYSIPGYWPAILISTHIWQTMGMNSIVYYAALVSLDSEILESAELDGANSRQKAWYIMVPHLTSIIVIMTILGIGGIFGGDFGLFFQVPKNIGLLYPTTDIISTYTYRAMIGGSMDKSTAIGLFQSIMGLILVVGTNLIVRKISPENSLF